MTLPQLPSGGVPSVHIPSGALKATDDHIAALSFTPPNMLKTLARNLLNIAQVADDAAYDELIALGRELVPALADNTPKGQGKLAKSTKFKIIRHHHAQGSNFELQLFQTASNVYNGVPYHYWYTLHHGFRPKGRLSQTMPKTGWLADYNSLMIGKAKQAVRNLKLLAPLDRWVMKKFGLVNRTEIRRKARSIAFLTWKRGRKPNPYIRKTYREKEDRIEETAQRIQQEIVLQVGRLPDVATAYSSRKGWI